MLWTAIRDVDRSSANAAASTPPRRSARTRPDLLFLDVQMPEVDGFDVLEASAPDAVPVIVFVTAYDQYALRAFEVHALDYLLKPFDDARFARRCARAKAAGCARAARGAVDARSRDLLAERERTGRTRGASWCATATRPLVVDAGRRSTGSRPPTTTSQLHAGGRVHLLRERLAELEQRLDPAQFVRIHRSAIVNLERVREIHPLFRGDCELVVLRRRRRCA